MLILAIGLAGLVLRLAVPAGFMPVLDHGRLTLMLCSGYGTAASEPVYRAASVAPAGEPHHQDAPRADGSCAFADLSLSMIGGAGSVQTAGALLFLLAAALFFAAVLPPRAALRLRPPLRGPPLPA
jgi:hypothetical protein